MRFKAPDNQILKTVWYGFNRSRKEIIRFVFEVAFEASEVTSDEEIDST